LRRPRLDLQTHLESCSAVPLSLDALDPARCFEWRGACGAAVARAHNLLRDAGGFLLDRPLLVMRRAAGVAICDGRRLVSAAKQHAPPPGAANAARWRTPYVLYIKPGTEDRTVVRLLRLSLCHACFLCSCAALFW
jgi:hypothetical protein